MGKYQQISRAKLKQKKQAKNAVIQDRSSERQHSKPEKTEIQTDNCLVLTLLL